MLMEDTKVTRPSKHNRTTTHEVTETVEACKGPALIITRWSPGVERRCGPMPFSSS